jgi:hypothetical protein
VRRGGKAEHNKVSLGRGREKHRVCYLTYFHPMWTTRWEGICRKFLWFVSVHEKCIRKKTKQNKEGPQFIFKGARENSGFGGNGWLYYLIIRCWCSGRLFCTEGTSILIFIHGPTMKRAKSCVICYILLSANNVPCR